MIMNLVKAEWIKLKRSNMWLAVVSLPLLGIFIGSGSYYINRTELSGEVWQELWTQVGLFYGYFFFPILISICASYMWRLEHMNHNWNMIMTAPIKIKDIFLSKFIVLAAINLIPQIILIILYILSGKVLFGFKDAVPVNALFWLFGGWFASLSVGAMQLYISMRIRSFSIPIGIGLCTCIAGLFFYVTGFKMFFPTSLLIVGMGSLRAKALGGGEAIAFSVMCILYVLFFSAIAARRLKKIDIKA